MRRLSIQELHAEKIKELGLDPTAVDLTSTEAVACALRRIAGFLCPCAASTLIRGVLQPLRGLINDSVVNRSDIESVLELLIAHGDIIEQFESDKNQVRRTGALLYSAPPSFVLRQSGVALLLGIATDQRSALPDELEDRIEYVGHMRMLVPQKNEDLRSALVQLGLVELSYDRWLRSPTILSPAHHVSHHNELLSKARISGDIHGLTILDTSRSTRYYRGRWVEPESHTGKFVGRRPQAYGADIWCYVELERGSPRRCIDLPLRKSIWRGCDEAWQLQAAIDHESNCPQVFKVGAGPHATKLISFFSPVPMWATRKWNAIGEPVELPGYLFTYKFDQREAMEEISYIKNTLWLVETD